MSEPQTIKWTGQSGTQYTYWIYPRGQKFTGETPGNYIHAKETESGSFIAIYVGQTKDLNVRLSNHEKQQCVDSHGATHLHVHANNKGEAARLAEESDLIARLQPACNVQGIR